MKYFDLFRLTLWALVLSLAVCFLPRQLRPGVSQTPDNNFTSPTEITQPPQMPEAVISFSKEDLQYIQVNLNLKVMAMMLNLANGKKNTKKHGLSMMLCGLIMKQHFVHQQQVITTMP